MFIWGDAGIGKVGKRTFSWKLVLRMNPKAVLRNEVKTLELTARRAKVKGKVASDSLQPHWLSMEFSRPEYWSGQPFPSPGGLPNPGVKPRSPALQADSLPVEPHGEPKKHGVRSLSLLQQIFLTQESNRGLLHCRQILYQLSCQRSPQGDLFPPSIERRIFCTLGKRGNHYTMETTHILERLNIREVKNYIRA